MSKYGLIYASAAQKVDGPAGLTVVIARRPLGQTVAGTPTMFEYHTQAENDSMYNTPPTYAIYIAGLVFNT